MTLTTLLAILQQSEYDSGILRRWVKAHKDEKSELQPEKWTAKLKLIRLICQALFFLPSLTGIDIALFLLFPIEQIIRQQRYAKAKAKLTQLRQNGLKVIAIAGSYAKTSSKNILTHALADKNEVLATPHSINTLLGIADVIQQELTTEHKIFIVELGEYHPEDIPALTQFIQPDLGILTPIGRQHLEIIGGMKQLIASLTHFVEYFTQSQNLLVHEINKQYFPDFAGSFYGVDTQSQFQVVQTQISRAGTEFSIIEPATNQTLHCFIPLFGEHQAVNTLTAIWAGKQLGIETKAIVKRLRTLPYITRRHEPRFAENNVLILDNSYNTNPDSVIESLKLVNQLEPTKRFIVTVGFTELGEESKKIHHEYGQQLANQIDYVGLIKAPWSDNIVDGFVEGGGQKDHIFIADSQEAAFAQIQQFVVPGSVILFEGGYREVYV